MNEHVWERERWRRWRRWRRWERWRQRGWRRRPLPLIRQRSKPERGQHGGDLLGAGAHRVRRTAYELVPNCARRPRPCEKRSARVQGGVGVARGHRRVARCHWRPLDAHEVARAGSEVGVPPAVEPGAVERDPVRAAATVALVAALHRPFGMHGGSTLRGVVWMEVQRDGVRGAATALVRNVEAALAVCIHRASHLAKDCIVRQCAAAKDTVDQSEAVACLLCCTHGLDYV